MSRDDEHSDELRNLHERVRELTREFGRLQAEHDRLSAQAGPVPQLLAAALAMPRRTRPARVRLDCRGRKVTAWIDCGQGGNPAVAWASILTAVPADPAAVTGRLSADLARGVIAVRDGRTLIVSARASRTDLRACRTAGVAAAGGAAAAALRKVKTSSALQAGLGGAAAAAIVATGALTIGHSPRKPGGLPPGALAPNVRGIPPRPAAHTVHGGGAPGAGGSPEAAGALPRYGTQGRAPAAKLTILPSIPAPAPSSTPAHRKPGPKVSIVPVPAPHRTSPAPHPTSPQPSPTRPAPGPTITIPLPSPLPTVTVPIPLGVIPPHVLPSPIPQVVHHVVHQVHHLVHHLVHQVHHLVHHLLPTSLPTLPGGL